MHMQNRTLDQSGDLDKARSKPRQRASVSVTTRRQTKQESQDYQVALDAVLAEWVRQHLGAEGKRS